MERQGLDVVKVFHPDMLRGEISCTSMITKNDTAKQIAIIFRGSTVIQDWIIDVLSTPIPFILAPTPYQPVSGAAKCPGNCLTHTGVYDQFKKAFKDIYAVFKPLKDTHPDYEVIVTGLSLGGGYAHFMGIELQLLGYKPHVCAFGSLRIGNKDFNDWVDDIFQSEDVSRRIRNNEMPRNAFYVVMQEWDIVSMIPAGPTFTRSGVEFKIRNDETFFPEKKDITFEGAKQPLKDFFSEYVLSGRLLDVLRTIVHLNYFRRQGWPCLPDSSSLDGRWH
ncbi:FAER453Cp [Eremothecium gossypii FDAG1]|nr:FAER453Cp [Eremothecium gossypii FDAG1]